MSLFNPDNYRQLSILRPDRIKDFWSCVDKSGSTDESRIAVLAGRVSSPCHLWTRNKGQYGYGEFQWQVQGGRKHPHTCKTHILAYYLTKNDLPGVRHLELDHICRIRHCCNPDHLEPVSHATNNKRGLVLRIPEPSIRLIRYLHEYYKCPVDKLVELTGLCEQSISSIINH